MRKLAKGEPLERFTAYLRKNHPQRWEDVPSDIKRKCRTYILEKEQKGLSGYTEKPLDDDNQSLHIDHFRKRQLFNTAVFDWNNFIVDEKDMEYGADAKDSKNGVKSRDEYSMIINPVEEDPRHYFQYMTDGCIIPSQELDGTKRNKAQHTIDIFNLNHPALCSLRKVRMRQVKQLKEGNMTAEEVVEILQNEGFPSVVEYFCQSQVFMVL